MQAPFFFADIFDSPWIVVLIILGTPLINWLTKKREEAKLQQAPEEKKAGTAEERAAMAELLRQLMGEPPAKAPAPPPLPAWDDDEDELVAPAPSSRRTGPPALPATRGTVQAINRERELAKQRVKQLKEEHRHLAGKETYGNKHRKTTGKRGASPWRDRKKARQAFVASLIFAPPKGLEMDRR